MMAKDELLQKMKLGLVSPEEAVREFEKSEKKIMSGLKRTYVPPTIEDIRGRYTTNQELIERAQSSTIPFITPDLGPEFRLSQGLILIGGVSGKGKSTTNANILAGFVKTNPNEQAMVVSNEESTGEVYDRVACIIKKYNYKAYRARHLSKHAIAEVQKISGDLMHQIIVEDGSGNYDMTCSDDLKAVLAYVADSNVKLASVDYFQTVNWSSSKLDNNPVQVSKELGFWLKDYGRKVPKPVIMYVQLKETSDDTEFKERVENDRTVFNHAFMAVEVVPDFETGISKFVFFKDRFGESQGKTVELQYIGGRFEHVGGL